MHLLIWSKNHTLPGKAKNTPKDSQGPERPLADFSYASWLQTLFDSNHGQKIKPRNIKQESYN